MNQSTPTILLLGIKDVDEAMRLVRPANWNQTRLDWLRLIRLEPRGCFAAWLNGRIVATITTTTYATELAWIGMMFVAPECRRRGLATELVRIAIDYLSSQGVRTVKLDATTEGRLVYEAQGFTSEALIQRWTTIARPVNVANVSVVDAAMWPELQCLDHEAFQADRTNLLETLMADGYVPPLSVKSPQGGLQGYALARQGTAACYVGPIVAVDERSALSLLDGMSSRLVGKKLFLDINTTIESRTTHLSERGFSKQRDLIRMSFGTKSNAGTSTNIFAIAGPEVG